MASAISHPAVALAVGAVFTKEQLPRRFWLLGAACTLLPDIDVLGMLIGIRYSDMLGHRGITHSAAFAAVLALLFGLPMAARDRSVSKACLISYLFLCTASHGLLDALTDGGLGVAFFAPFSNSRYFLPWRPIPVSPFSPVDFFGPRGITILLRELQWAWLPSLGTALIARLIRHTLAHRRR
ncbi:metal-dependent hydrolase [Candidatus Methylomirabilis sp.]|uniref:metal-dependent hydrolase n=1 Tax=Candidatus Methylomirabilis sp. TaxID=2032687 RepID=UPI003C777CF4